MECEIASQKQQNICEKLPFLVTFGQIWVKPKLRYFVGLRY